MNARERFVATMRYEPVDRPVLWEWGSWSATIKRWQQEGGYVDELIPLFIEAGVRGMYPLEVNSGMDVAALRRKYGRELLMYGGIDKRALAAGPDAIDLELERCAPVALAGGYVPTVDHSLPPDISYANFQYYWRRKKEILGID